VLYLIILVFDPDAFNGIEIASWQEGFAKIAYYSFVTLTTLGYGDISPKTPVAQFFVYMEAIAGVFYMAIVVSSIVAMRLASVRLPKEREK
jgi:voltage-gated potassium channel Kch